VWKSELRDPKTIASAGAICVAAALWGLDGVVLTPRLSGIPVLFVVFLIHAVPFLVMQPILFSTWREMAAMNRKSWLALVVVSTTGGLVGTVAIVKALFLVQFDMLSVVVVLQKLQPVFAISLAAVLLKERITGGFLARAAVALGGGYLLTFGFHAPRIGGGSNLVPAAALALLAAACFGAATTLSKMLIGGVDVRTATFGRYGVTAALALITCIGGGVGLPLKEVTQTQWFIIIIIGMTSGTTALVLYYWGLQRIRASVATICELCLPLSAIILDYVVNGTILRPAQWLGAAILMAAIMSITLAKNGQKSDS
jgi:drug/metabolite transporter (DMT)-like permease